MGGPGGAEGDSPGAEGDSPWVRSDRGVGADDGPVEDFGDLLVAPGLVDPHVHVNEPGRTDWEGFRTLTRAAAAGGITTLVDMPLNSIPPTTTLAALQVKRAAAEGQCWVDVGFWGGAVPGNLSEMAPMHDAGIFGFKCFLVPSGVDEFGHLTPDLLRPAMAEIARFGGLMLVHAEVSGPIDAAAGVWAAEDPRSYRTYLKSRPPEAEREAIALVAEVAQKTDCRAHIVHLSAAPALEILEIARGRLPLSVETCPHYLSFTADDVPRGATQYKCAPPIRDLDNRESLWDGLRGGLLDMVVADHSPSPPALKSLDTGDFAKAWGGISSLQLTLAATWTEARRRGFGVEDIVRWMSHNTARHAGLVGRKGALAVGCDADIVVWDPEETFTVDAAALHHRHPLSPYQGRVLHGVVKTTFLRGQKIFDGGRLVDTPLGRLLP
ncbi:MAG: allantoinase AllB [Armatimonadetes bacterium]|nr:allantoinase AllB [Armatimonadota bacterium]